MKQYQLPVARIRKPPSYLTHRALEIRRQRCRHRARPADPGAAIDGDGAEIFFVQHIIDRDAQINTGKAVAE